MSEDKKAKFVYSTELEALKKAGYTYMSSFDCGGDKEIHCFNNNGDILKLKKKEIENLIFTNKLFL